jgi:DNA-binding SARP family transcriptional activator
MSALSVRLFGQLSVCRGDQVIEDLIPGKAKELFCYLLTHRERPPGREFLATVLWEDCTPEHSKQYLRKALWQLQRALGMSESVEEPVLHADSRRVAISSAADIWVDVVEFENLCLRAQGPTLHIDDAAMQALENAVALYRGDLLEGWYCDWCLYDRERLQNIYLVALDKLVSWSEAHHAYEKGIEYASRILHSDRAHEVAHQRLMRLRYLSGDRQGALRQYENCAAVLKGELGVQPSERTREIYRKIREDSTPAITAPARETHEYTEEHSLLQGTLNRLTEIKTALSVLQSAVDESLLRVRQAVSNRNEKSSR